MRVYLVFGVLVTLTGCFSAGNFDSCTGPSQCGRNMQEGNEDRVYICRDGQCVDPQDGHQPVPWQPGLSPDQVVTIDRNLNLSSGDITPGSPLIIQHRGIIIEQGFIVDVSGAGHPGGGGGGGGQGVVSNGAMGAPVPGAGGMVEGGNSGASGNISLGGDGGAGTGESGGPGGPGDSGTPFTGRACVDRTGGAPGEQGVYDLSVSPGQSFDPCQLIPLNAPPMGSGGGGGGGGRGGSVSGAAWGGGGGGVGGGGGGAILLIATEFIEIRGALSAKGNTGGVAPECVACQDGDGGLGASESATGGSGPECVGGGGGGGGGGLVYLQAPKLVFGAESSISVDGSAGAANGGHIIFRGEIEDLPTAPVTVQGIGVHDASRTGLICYGNHQVAGVR